MGVKCSNLSIVMCHVLLKFMLRVLLIILQTLILNPHVQTRNFIPFQVPLIHIYIYIYIYTHTHTNAHVTLNSNFV